MIQAVAQIISNPYIEVGNPTLIHFDINGIGLKHVHITIEHNAEIGSYMYSSIRSGAAVFAYYDKNIQTIDYIDIVGKSKIPVVNKPNVNNNFVVAGFNQFITKQPFKLLIDDNKTYFFGYNGNMEQIPLEFKQVTAGDITKMNLDKLHPDALKIINAVNNGDLQFEYCKDKISIIIWSSQDFKNLLDSINVDLKLCDVPPPVAYIKSIQIESIKKSAKILEDILDCFPDCDPLGKELLFRLNYTIKLYNERINKLPEIKLFEFDRKWYYYVAGKEYNPGDYLFWGDNKPTDGEVHDYGYRIHSFNEEGIEIRNDSGKDKIYQVLKNGKFVISRKDGPAIEWFDGGKNWYLDGKLHREDGPAIENLNRTNHYYLNGILYTEERWKEIVNDLKDPPSFSGKDIKYWKNSSGKLHRINGPAYETGSLKEWWVNGELHREGGPAIESEMTKEWWTHGKLISKFRKEKGQFYDVNEEKLDMLNLDNFNETFETTKDRALDDITYRFDSEIDTLKQLKQVTHTVADAWRKTQPNETISAQQIAKIVHYYACLPSSIDKTIEDIGLKKQNELNRITAWADSWDNFLKTGDDKLLDKALSLSITEDIVKFEEVKEKTFKESISEDLSDSVYRIAANQLAKASNKVILASMNKTKEAKELFDSKLGQAVTTLTLGHAITQMTDFDENSKAQKLARQLRIEGMAGIENEAIDLVLNAFKESSSDLIEEKVELYESKDCTA